MGIFVAIEGGDGSGKATQTEILRKYLANTLHLDVLKLSFPQYGEKSAYYAERYLNGIYGEANEVHPELGILPYALDRFAAGKLIREHLQKENSIVLSDRYMASNLAHQGAKIQDKSERKAFYERTMETEYEILGIPRPSLNIVLLVPSNIAQENVDKKDIRSYTDKKRDIHEADEDHLDLAKRNYEELCEYYPDEFIAIECTDDGFMRSIEDIKKDITAIFESKIG